MNTPCIICGYPDGKVEMDTHQKVAVRLLDVNCPRCGIYHLEYSTFSESKQFERPKQLTGKALDCFIGYTREQTIKRNKIHVTANEFDDYVKYAVSQAPQTPSDKIDRFLYNISNRVLKK